VKLPREVTDWIREAFDEASKRTANLMARVPNCPEESVDVDLVSALEAYSYPVEFPDGWAVRLTTHFIGGLKQYRSWEVADIGLFVVIRQHGRVLRNKVCLLQSKRLYPTNEAVEVKESLDYGIGMLAHLQKRREFPVAVGAVNYVFDGQSKYGALVAHDRQHELLKEFAQANATPVHYLLYSPPTVPFSVRLPRGPEAIELQPVEVGAVVVIGAQVLSALDAMSPGQTPTYDGIHAAARNWSLGSFVADEFLVCRQGRILGDLEEPSDIGIFYRRSGPIFASIVIGIEAPDDAELVMD